VGSLEVGVDLNDVGFLDDAVVDDMVRGFIAESDAFSAPRVVGGHTVEKCVVVLAEDSVTCFDCTQTRLLLYLNLFVWVHDSTARLTVLLQPELRML